MQKVKKKLKNKKNNSINEAVNRIIRKEKSFTDLDIPFARSFYKNLLKEEEKAIDISDEIQKSPDDFDETSTDKAYKDSLEPETSEKQFDVEGLNPDISTESIKKIKEWSSKLNTFAEFLNDPSDNSLHRIIADNDKPGSLLRGITRKASDSITRIAGEIEKLKEVLNGFIIMAPKKLRDSEQLQ
jgi:uncharacterized membrane-anchored protein YjiN (DUF445 family)